MKTTNNEKNRRTCPVELAGGLDNYVRRLLQNPRKLLNPYISKGMTVLDLGCGPGFFSIEIAKMLIDSGKVIAADLQEGMLEKVNKKIKGTEMNLPVASYGVSKHLPHEASLAASCGELTPNEIRAKD